MPRELVLVLDIGTSSVRATLFGLDAEPVEGSEARVSYQPRVDAGGRAELDADWLVSRCRAVLARSLRTVARGDDVLAVGVSTFWHGLLGLDGSHRPVTPIWLWSDQRSWRQAAELAAHPALARFHERTGAPMHSSYWPAKLAWCHAEKPDVWARVRHWVSFTDYLHLQLFGELGTTRSMASATGLCRLDDGTWDAELTRRLEVDPATLPPRREEYRGLRPEMRRGLVRAAGARWFGAAGDGATAAVGTDGDREARRALTIGTSAAMRTAVSEPPRELPRGLWCYVIEEGTFLAGGAFNNGGNLRAWLVDRLQLDSDTLERALRRLPPASADLTFLPLLSGERSPGFAPHATGSIAGLTEATSAIDVARAGMEAVAALLRPLDRGLDALLGDHGRVVVSGGGLVHSGAWCQVVADALEKPVASIHVEEASSRGAAILALRRLGASPPARLPLAHTWRPRPRAAATYAALEQRLTHLYAATVTTPL